MSVEEKTSKISGFYKMPVEKRLELVKKFSDLNNEEIELFKSCLNMDIADRMIENVLGTFELPLGIAVNFKINGKDYLVPMVIEESSVVAAASNAWPCIRRSISRWESMWGRNCSSRRPKPLRAVPPRRPGRR